MENTKTSFLSSHHPYVPINVKFQKILEKYLVGIFVARDGGDILYSKSFQDGLKLPLMSNFIAALNVFGEENVGKIKRILIEGLDIEMNIVAKHGLVLTMMFRPHMVKDHISKYYEIGLDMFYDEFKEQIAQNRTNQTIYEQFDPKMFELLFEYLVHIEAL
ncbi:hypothetical protein NEF87_002493 [Candidatus Lokiarchaeum ossiferum]|uniref:Roadblock/LC7 domain-containing protein n=1 Tax=Candidatus Lokiarchaeum ossiferum TaxID=2951803 RepID=A0ABY6HRR7_9ARCH|nr:hypothetical protein NEF87_002493 [Candidatus Lokiarchaeum sp. B-35]